ncbi:hypothetical protein [Natronospora cellulosivora (SeqCode)]
MSENKKINYLGIGIVAGSALGIIFTLLIGANLSFGIIIGAVAGLLLGAVLANNKKRS